MVSPGPGLSIATLKVSIFFHTEPIKLLCLPAVVTNAAEALWKYLGSRLWIYLLKNAALSRSPRSRAYPVSAFSGHTAQLFSK